MEIEDDFSRPATAQPTDRRFEVAGRGQVELADERHGVATILLMFAEAQMASALDGRHLE
jgi:hypothetical protein